MTEKRLAANRRNARKSTGPRTTKGKATVATNAVKHGLRALSVAIPGMERLEDWEAHRDLVVRDLDPRGYLERVLSERVAALLWRLGRVVRYETEASTTATERVLDRYQAIRERGEELAQDTADLETLRARVNMAKEALELFRAIPDLEDSTPVDADAAGAVIQAAAAVAEVELLQDGEDPPTPYSVTVTLEDLDGWTAGTVREALGRVEHEGTLDMAPLAEETLRALEFTVQEREKEEADGLQAMEQARRGGLLPSENVLGNISRYETHLERSLFKTLHELQRLQAWRDGEAPPPAALDLDVSVTERT